MTKYQVISNNNLIDLTMVVNGWLESGWELQGGVSMAIFPNGDLKVAQAIVWHRKDKKRDSEKD